MNRYATSGLYRRGSNCVALLITILPWLIALTLPCRAQEPGAEQKPVTELGKTEAWVGEPVPFTITLYSPGPFSGTANFQIPELESTVIISRGNPVLGNETIDGESYLSQRHNFLVISQKSGKVIIPSIPVLFAGKPDFVSEAVERSSQSDSVSIEFERPPGFEANELVISATKFSVSQDWNGVDTERVEAGAILERSITQKIEGSTALFLQDANPSAIEGVAIYPESPVVEDTIVRGAVSGTKIDTLKYQFQKDGQFQLPDIDIRWWNLEEERLETETLAGQIVKVVPGATTAKGKADEKPSLAWLFVSVVALLMLGTALVVLQRIGIIPALGSLLERKKSAADLVLEACAESDPVQVYSAFLSWRKTVHERALDEGMQAEWDALTRRLYRDASGITGWQSEGFRTAFREQIKAREVSHSEDSALGPLNPS